MKWEGQRESENVEDVRSSGGGRGLPIGGRGLGVGGIVVALLASWAFGINPMTVLGLLDGGGGQPVQPSTPAESRPQDQAGRFVSTVLADTEDTWKTIFAESGSDFSRIVRHSWIMIR